MGLLDEAIAEFQKVCSAIERGKEFGQPVQTYTWLAQCFLDKGVPEAAIRCTKRRLKFRDWTTRHDWRSAMSWVRLAKLRATSRALRHFTDVYITNIDYRDVAERIQALKS